jgi:hypothetical protein
MTRVGIVGDGPGGLSAALFPGKRSVRRTPSRAIISAGAGAVAAVDIFARENGKVVQDWDTPSKE